jgi:uncharacterized protein YidB (DUF937 family)
MGMEEERTFTMSFLDDLMQQAGGLASVAAKNPQAVAAVVSLLSSRDPSVGGSSGLAGVVDAFTKKGLGGMVSSWISTGPNPPVTASQVTDALGSDVVKQFAAKAGVSHAEAGPLLASLLPVVIDQLTPKGAVPEGNALESTLSGLLSELGK